MVSYLSVCSGIEAASVAWHPLGWRPLAFSEIEPFPRAVLQHHYPDVPLHGDFTVLRDQSWIADADVLVGGTPCQAFSVAGLRNSLADERGNLSLEFVRLADAIDNYRCVAGKDSAIIIWENVPGVLSVKDNAFGCFLAALAGDAAPYDPPRGKWTNAGVVDGPARTVAWRILDAQYFGLAQRRRRVFVVASARDGFDPAAVLLEFEGVRRDTPPSREAGQIAPTIPSRSTAGGGLGTDFDCDGGVIRQTWPADLAPTLNAHFGEKQGLEDQHINGGGGGLFVPAGITHALRAEGFDASEDGTGRGTPLVPVQAFYSTESRCNNIPPPGISPPLKVGSGGTSGNPPAVTYSIMPQNSGRDYKAREVEVAQPIMAGGPVGGNQGGDYVLQPIAYAFQPRIARNGRGDMGDVVNALNAQSGETGKGDAAPCVAVAFAQNTRDEVREMPYVGALAAEPGMKQTSYVRQEMAVRRLTPVECERLQGFPDGYTNIPWRKQPTAPDDPRYKALGNSMAVPVMRWIGKRVANAIA